MSSKTRKFESLLEAVPDALVGMDQVGVIRFVNQQTESLFGYDRDDLVGQPIQMLVPQYLWEVYSEHREEYFADPRSRSMGLDLQLGGSHHDGTDLPVNISLSHLDTGDVLLVITAVDEVTRHAHALEDSKLLAAIVEHSNDAIVAKTLDGIITSWNPAAERMYGYSSREVIGRSINLLVPEDRVDELDALVVKINAGQAVERLETVRIRKDGTRFPVSLTISPIHDEDRTIIGASVIGRDMTRQKDAFEASRTMAAIVRFSREAIFGTTLDGTITSWNPAAERIFGYSGEEIIGRSGRLITPADEVDHGCALLKKIAAGQDVERLETTCVKRDGTAFPVSLSVAPIRDPAGVVVGLSAVAHEVLQRK